MGAGLSGTQPPWLAGHTFAPRLDPCAGVAEASKWTWRNRLTSGMWRWGVPQRNSQRVTRPSKTNSGRYSLDPSSRGWWRHPMPAQKSSAHCENAMSISPS